MSRLALAAAALAVFSSGCAETADDAENTNDNAAKKSAGGVRLQDYDGDGKADPIVFRPGNSNWYAHPSTGVADIVSPYWGYGSDILVPGDYDGDGRTDFGVWRPEDGTWYVRLSSGKPDLAIQFGASNDIPLAGDYDGDGKQDPTVFRVGQRTYYVHPSTGGDDIVYAYGQSSTDRQVPGDYDGDRKTDFAYVAANGDWHVHASKTGAESVVNWGDTNDQMLPADYDGDGITDLAYFRPYEGKWHILQSATGTEKVATFGTMNDRMVPADYDGDRHADLAYFHPADGTWHIRPSKKGSADYSVQFGEKTDMLPYHLYSGNCGGFNPQDRLTPPYNCGFDDFRMMQSAGWPRSDWRRGTVVGEALFQITKPITDGGDVAGIGRCGSSGRDFYLASGNWCSEFVRDVYLWSWIVKDMSINGNELDEVEVVDDMVYLFQRTSSSSWYSRDAMTLNKPQPGDYLAEMGGESGNEHYGHSAMVLAVSDDYATMWTMNGNYGWGNDHCVVMTKQPFYTGLPDIIWNRLDMLGVLTAWLL
jgi:hypothetical protein